MSLTPNPSPPINFSDEALKTVLVDALSVHIHHLIQSGMHLPSSPPPNDQRRNASNPEAIISATPRTAHSRYPPARSEEATARISTGGHPPPAVVAFYDDFSRLLTSIRTDLRAAPSNDFFKNYESLDGIMELDVGEFDFDAEKRWFECLWGYVCVDVSLTLPNFEKVSPLWFVHKCVGQFEDFLEAIYDAQWLVRRKGLRADLPHDFGVRARRIIVQACRTSDVVARYKRLQEVFHSVLSAEDRRESERLGFPEGGHWRFRLGTTALQGLEEAEFVEEIMRGVRMRNKTAYRAVVQRNIEEEEGGCEMSEDEVEEMEVEYYAFENQEDDLYDDSDPTND
ncbi:hypothetical protein CVT24_007141 [Panaeolus cyanescens]|uniref:Uncharacterized protein n=1 Tax=Panaeolus cyanescens TaxID=181874 RepID=A0A409YPG7_9AGAR|nr:hypothetical protein CVT24_007141 [Panaeolus cyanescens]